MKQQRAGVNGAAGRRWSSNEEDAGGAAMSTSEAQPHRCNRNEHRWSNGRHIAELQLGSSGMHTVELQLGSTVMSVMALQIEQQ